METHETNVRANANRYGYTPTGQTLQLHEWHQHCKDTAKFSKRLGKTIISNRKIQWMHILDAGYTKCVASGIEIDHISLDRCYFRGKAKRGQFSEHWNFYGKHGQLFTVDHIHPVSKEGGVLDADNLQPMISEHNNLKSDTIITSDYELYQGEVKPNHFKVIGKSLNLQQVADYLNEHCVDNLLLLDDAMLGRINEYLLTLNTSSSTITFEPFGKAV